MPRQRRNQTEYGFRKQEARPVARRPAKPRILIVCEGGKTEPQYFRAFPVTSAKVNAEGVGSSCMSLVELAATLRDEEGRTSRQEGLEGGYDQVWCVFDKDSFADEDFRQAIARAKRLGFRVAYTNEAFELWFLLHYAYYDSALSRHQYSDKLTAYLKRPYRKNDPMMYEVLLPMQNTAIANAQRLYATYSPHDPAKDNPCTTVHELVVELNRWTR